MIRNAGGRASDDAIRSLVISYKLLGTRGVRDPPPCGMEFFSNDLMSDLCGQSLETAELGPGGFTDVGTGGGSNEAKFIDWMTIGDTEGSVVDDVTRIRQHPLVPGRIPIYGYVYDVRTGRLMQVDAATEAGRSR